MKKIDLLMIILFLGTSAWVLHTHKGYDEVNDTAQWRPLNDMDREGWFLRVGDSIYGTTVEDINCCIKYTKPLKKIDARSFVVSKDCEYAKDKNHVYYPISAICEDWWEADSEGCADIDYIKMYLVVGADPKTFKYLYKTYGIDKHYMYFLGERIPWDDKIILRAKQRSL
ncbi:DKNYY domain-containing protein [uncultured Duncaniella sp.]|uniref:DKNYY domain-containing protein n=1 Tax=uncultured Duncaniella sp. TaxID=2768039 RepID=UPI0025F2410D|nr:DKNYY domain-containing protein [uncultured Duncaniella sp.]